MRSRYEAARRILVFWTLFIGIGAVGGAAMMLLDPSGKTMGMDGMLPYFQVLPFAEVVFQDLAFSGIALFIVNGLTNLAAAGLLLARKKAGVVLGGIFGVTLMLWICIQFYIFPPNFMSTIYFIFGFCQAAAGKIREVDYILVHHTGGRYQNTAEEMDALLGLRHTGLRSYRCRMGSFQEIKE